MIKCIFTRFYLILGVLLGIIILYIYFSNSLYPNNYCHLCSIRGTNGRRSTELGYRNSHIINQRHVLFCFNCRINLSIDKKVPKVKVEIPFL